MPTQPRYRPALDPKHRPVGPYTLIDELRFAVPACRREAFAPAGFDGFNGASIPQPLWGVIGHPLTPAFLRAATVHDALYQNAPGARAANGSGGIPADRDEADRLFHAILLQDGVSKAKAHLMYTAVQRFGARRYDRHDAPGLDEKDYQQATEAAGAVSFDGAAPQPRDGLEDLSPEEREELRQLQEALHAVTEPPNR